MQWCFESLRRGKCGLLCVSYEKLLDGKLGHLNNQWWLFLLVAPHFSYWVDRKFHKNILHRNPMDFSVNPIFCWSYSFLSLVYAFAVVVLVSHVWFFCDPMDCNPPGSPVHGISQARVLEWVAVFSSRGSSWPRDWTPVSCISGAFFTTGPPGKPDSVMYKHLSILFQCFSILA